MANLDDLEELLKLLRKHGVRRYEDVDYVLELGEPAEAPPRDFEQKAASRASSNERPAPGRPVNKYAHPSLWPTGKPPAFDDE